MFIKVSLWYLVDCLSGTMKLCDVFPFQTLKIKGLQGGKFTLHFQISSSGWTSLSWLWSYPLLKYCGNSSWGFIPPRALYTIVNFLVCHKPSNKMSVGLVKKVSYNSKNT